jgi:RNA polymerase sigma-70 factor, ECF subfamily
MNTTSESLLERLRRPDAQEAWVRFVELYTPLIYYWARRAGLQTADASDLAQEVLTVLVQKLPEFQYDRHKSFRGWLRTVTLNKWREGRRRRELPREALQNPLEEVPGPEDGASFGETEYREYLVGRALTMMQAEFEPTTWKACWEYVVGGRSVTSVASELSITTNAVYLAKSRVLRRLRVELDGLLD